MVMTLTRLANIEDKNLLAGHVLALVHQEYDQAQRHFLASSQKRAALDLRRDLRHWDKALELAQELDPTRCVPSRAFDLPPPAAPLVVSLSLRSQHAGRVVPGPAEPPAAVPVALCGPVSR